MKVLNIKLMTDKRKRGLTERVNTFIWTSWF